MIAYLQKFNELSQELKDNISSPQVMAAISELEKIYNVSLATVVMRVMVKDILLDELPRFFESENHIDSMKAIELVRQLKDRVFCDVLEYLGIVLDEEGEQGVGDAEGVVAKKLDKKVETVVHGDTEKGVNKKTIVFDHGKIVDRTSEKVVIKKTADAKVMVSQGKKLDNWMEGKKEETAVKSSAFFFSPEDEEEVLGLAKKVKEFKKDSITGEEKDVKKKEEEKYNEIVNKVKRQIHVSFSSDDLDKRFTQILRTYARGVRNKLDTKQSMLKDVKSGGLGIGESLAGNVISTTDEIRAEFARNERNMKKPGGIKVPEDVAISGKDKEKKEGAEKIEGIVARDVEYDFGKLLKKEGQADILTSDSINGAKQREVVSIPEKKEALVSSEQKEIESLLGDVKLEEDKEVDFDGKMVQESSSVVGVAGEGTRIQEKIKERLEEEKVDEVNVGSSDPEAKVVSDIAAPIDKDKAKREKEEAEKKQKELEKRKQIKIKDEVSESFKHAVISSDVKDEVARISVVDPTMRKIKEDAKRLATEKKVKEEKKINKKAAGDGFFLDENKRKEMEDLDKMYNRSSGILNLRKTSDGKGSKVAMHDVKYVPKLTGPVEELGTMSLVNFRRLSENPNSSANKIKDKVQFLEDDNYAKRLAGVKAWRQSPVNKLYLELGEESIRTKTAIDAIINIRRDEGGEYLTVQEFAAIMDLNKSLRF